MGKRKPKVKVPDQLNSGLFGTNFLVNQTAWDRGEFSVHFRPRLSAVLTQDVEMIQDTSVKDTLAQTFDREGSQLEQEEFGKEMEKALGDVGDHRGTLPKGMEVNVHGIYARFKFDHKWEQTALGSISRPVAICSPMGIMLSGASPYMPIPCDYLFVDWLVANNKDVTDITVKQISDQIFSWKIQDENRSILVPGIDF